jgi:hypothetical protein
MGRLTGGASPSSTIVREIQTHVELELGQELENVKLGAKIEDSVVLVGIQARTG